MFNMISGGQFDGIEINDDKKTTFQFLFQGNLLNSQQIQNFVDLNGNPFGGFYDFVQDGWIGIMPWFDIKYGNTEILNAEAFSSLNRKIRPNHVGMCRFFRDVRVLDTWNGKEWVQSWVRNNPQGEIILNPKTDWE